MSDLKQEYVLSLYEMESVISDSTNSEVSVVTHTISKKKYICKKIKNSDSYHIYMQLKANPHRNLPAIEDIIVYDGSVYIIQELVSGVNLEQMLNKEKSLDKGKAIVIMSQLCDALEHLHKLKPPIIHRDVKPSNLIVCADGTVKLIDFDVSRNYKSDMLKDTQYLGTEGYASPEQFGYTQTDIRSDVYSAGILFYEILTGETNINQNKLDKKLLSVINKCTKLDPKERYQSAGELKRALRSLRKGNKGVVLGAMIILVVLGAVVYSLKMPQQQTPATITERLADTSTLNSLEPVGTTKESTTADQEVPVSEAVQETSAEVETTTEEQLSTEKETTQEGFSIDLKKFYINESSQNFLLDNEEIQKELKIILGNQYDYFRKIIYPGIYQSYDENTQSYCISQEDGMARAVIYQTGKIEGVILYNYEIYYFTNEQKEMQSMNPEIVNWVHRYQYYDFHTNIDTTIAEGTYINPENDNYVKISKDDTGYIVELGWKFGLDFSTIQGYLESPNLSNCYFSAAKGNYRLVFLGEDVLVLEYNSARAQLISLEGLYCKD